MSFADEYRNTIEYKLNSLIARLERAQIDFTKLAYAANEEEWSELETALPNMRYGFGLPTPAMPLEKLTYGGLLVVRKNPPKAA